MVLASMTDDPIHNHPTVQALLKDALVHRVAIVVLALLLAAGGVVLICHQVEMSRTMDMDQ